MVHGQWCPELDLECYYLKMKQYSKIFSIVTEAMKDSVGQRGSKAK